MKTRRQLAASFEAIAEQNEQLVKKILDTLKLSTPEQYDRRLKLAHQFAREAHVLRERALRLKKAQWWAR
jgi:hypothetical protein